MTVEKIFVKTQKYYWNWETKKFYIFLACRSTHYKQLTKHFLTCKPKAFSIIISSNHELKNLR